MYELEKKTVMLVDDTPANIKLLVSALKEDYKTKVALCGEKALDIVVLNPQPDLILLDIMMPGMDGFEVCKRLKSNDSTKNIPVIFLSGKADEETKSKCLELGAVDLIMKPIDLTEVISLVRSLIN